MSDLVSSVLKKYGKESNNNDAAAKAGTEKSNGDSQVDQMIGSLT